jgi:hypothetical protein
VTIVHSPSENAAVILADHVPVPEGDRVYELWAINDNVPQRYATFRPDDPVGSASMPLGLDPASADVWAHLGGAGRGDRRADTADPERHSLTGTRRSTTGGHARTGACATMRQCAELRFASPSSTATLTRQGSPAETTTRRPRPRRPRPPRTTCRAGVVGQRGVVRGARRAPQAISDLSNVDVVRNGTSAITDALTRINDALGEVRSTAGTDVQPQVDAFQQSLDQLQTALGGGASQIACGRERRSAMSRRQVPRCSPASATCAARDAEPPRSGDGAYRGAMPALSATDLAMIEAARDLGPHIDARPAASRRIGASLSPSSPRCETPASSRCTLPTEVGGPEVHPSRRTTSARRWPATTARPVGVPRCRRAVTTFAAWIDPAGLAAMVERTGSLHFAGSARALGQAESVPGGFRAKGHWNYASGVCHANWYLGHVRHRQTRRTERRSRSMFFPWRKAPSSTTGTSSA